MKFGGWFLVVFKVCLPNCFLEGICPCLSTLIRGDVWEKMFVTLVQ